MDPKELKKYLIPTLAVFIVISVFNMIFHGMFMEKLYMANSRFFRPHEEICKHKYYMYLANLIYSTAFCYIYSKGHEKKSSIVQGVRYGLWITLLIWIPDTIVTWVVYPYPKQLLTRWLLGYAVQSILAGVTAAKLFKK